MESEPAVVRQRTRRTAGTLRRRWDWTFAILLLLSVSAALASFLFVGRLVDQFSAAAEAVDRKAAISSQLSPALTAQFGAAHQLLDFGLQARDRFLESDEAVAALFEEAEDVFDQPSELAALELARQEWTDSLAFLRPIAADPERAADPSAELGPDNPVHAMINENSQGVGAAMAELEGASHRELTHQLALGRAAERSLSLLLGFIATIGVVFTLYVGRRMRREFLVPVEQLRDSALRFSDGNLDHRAEVRRHDELGDLAATFNAMADAISAKHQQLSVQAFTDALTGLPNRASFHRAIGDAVGSADALDPLPACVMFIDLDDFKLVNDGMGHDAGDELLRQVAARLQTAVGATDVLARLGGDEFAVLLSAPSDEQRALSVADTMLDLLAAPFRIDGVPVRVGASIGVAVRTAATNDSDILVREADVAMYAAKGAGKHRCEIYQPAVHGALMDRMDTRATLDDAVANAELRLDYQPVADLATGTVVGVEALVRWEHPTRGLLLPGEFIPLAEETGQIIGIGRWVLDKACHEIAAWRNRNPLLGGLWVSVNLSSSEIYDPGLRNHLESVLQSSGLPAHNLVLEVTESVLLPHATQTADVLHKLKALGVRLALDDFGSGFSPLRYLDALPFDIVKVDGQIIADAGSEEGRQSILESIATLGQRLELWVVAEHIEDPDQLTVLRELGVAAGQGFLLAKPAPPAAVFDLVSKGVREAHAPITP